MGKRSIFGFLCSDIFFKALFALWCLFFYAFGVFIKVTKSGTRKYVQLVGPHRCEEGKPRLRTVVTLGRLDQIDRLLETMRQSLMRAASRVAPEKVSYAIEFESSRPLSDV